MAENNNTTNNNSIINNNRQKVEHDTKNCTFLARITIDHMSCFVHKMELRMASLLQILQQKPACACQNFPMRDYLLA
jgi:hypothetical protein